MIERESIDKQSSMKELTIMGGLGENSLNRVEIFSSLSTIVNLVQKVPGVVRHG